MMSILHSIADKNEDFKVFNDSVHGHMQMHPLCVKIIDTPEFQRLRNIKQLGTTYLVYPGASHNRFEHSLGVCYLAGEMVDALTQNQHSLKINATDKLCVQIAGLCHDLGHGPFSHLWEHFLKKKGISWNHEDQSVAMFYHLLQKNQLIDEFEKYGLDKVKRTFITELILGKGNSCDENKQFLFQIVCNQTNSIDVDKWDYFLRDGLHLNLKVSFDYRRLLNFCKVIEKEKDGKKKLHIAFRSKESYNIYEMFLVRSSLHYRAYQHRVSLAVNRMIIDALLAADEFYSMKLDGNFGLKLSEAHKNLNLWTRLTDNIFYDIIWKSSNDLATAQEILNRILYRRLYKFITSKKIFPTIDLGRKNENWLDDISRGLEEELNSKLKSVKFVVAYSSFYFGSNSPDPFKFVYFYDKNNPEEVEEKDWRDIALFPTNKKAESAHHVEIYIFCKHPEPNSLIEEEAKAWTDHFIESFIDNIA